MNLGEWNPRSLLQCSSEIRPSVLRNIAGKVVSELRLLCCFDVASSLVVCTLCSDVVLSRWGVSGKAMGKKWPRSRNIVYCFVVSKLFPVSLRNFFAESDSDSD